MPEAVPELVWFALLLFCFAFVWAARKLLAAMFGALINAVNALRIPYVGQAISDALHAMEQGIDNAMGSAVSGIDSLMGSSWHRFAQLNEWLWREFTQHTLIGYLLAQGLHELANGYHALRNIALGNTAAHAHDAARIKSLERVYRGIEAKIKTLERDYSKGIGEDVLPRLKTLEKEASRIRDVQIPAIQHAESDAASAISNLYEWAKGNADLLGVGTFAGAIAVAIGLDVFNGLRCRQLGGLMKKWGCGLGSLLDGLLGVMVSVFVLESVCEFLPYIEDAFGAIAGPMVNLLNDVPLGSCEIPPDSWAWLNVSYGALPPPQALGAFPVG